MNIISSAEKLGIKQGIQQGIEQGMQQGMQQGIQQGIQQGEATLLLSQLQARFNSIPEEFKKQINEADSEILIHWGICLMKAQSIEEIFQEK